MRSFARSALTIATLGLTALSWSACTATKQTEYVAGVSTQVTVPRDMQAIIVSVSVAGIPQFCQAYRVYDGKVQLPRSLGQFPSSGKASDNALTVTVVGLTDAIDNSNNPLYADCVGTAAKVGSNSARILRRSRQPYVQDEVLFLPMPLKFSCFDKDCGDGDDQTCKGGRCGVATIDPTGLPKYSPALLDGTGGACFAAATCFAAAVPVVVVDPNDCTYALPGSPSAPPLAVTGVNPLPFVSQGDGINVEVTYDGGFSVEVLDKDPVEGFTTPDMTKPQRFRLAPGLCDMVKGTDASVTPAVPTPHRITSIRATGICQAKSPYLPLCADDQNNAMGTPGGVSPNPTPTKVCKPALLTPAKSALMILADDSVDNSIFYNGGSATGMGSGEVVKESTVLTAALSDPAFDNTYIGLTFFPGAAGMACTPHPPAVLPVLSAAARPAIQAELSKRDDISLLAGYPTAFQTTPLDMTGALDDAYKELSTDFATANRRAVLLISNRSFDVSSCPDITPAARAKTAFDTDKTYTYVGLLARESDPTVPVVDPPITPPAANAIAVAGSPPAVGTEDAVRAFDSRTDKNQAALLLRKVLNDLATCAYDVAAAPDDATTLVYSDPVPLPVVPPAPPSPTHYAIPHNAACTSTTGTDPSSKGWGYDAADKRVFVCGSDCTQYRSVLAKAATYATTYSQPSLPVPLFAYASGCVPK